MKSDWKTLYILFSELWAKYSRGNRNEPLMGQQTLEHALNPTWSFARVDREVRSLGLPIELSDDWKSIELLRNAYDDMYENSGLTPKAPAASVYQTAIQIKRARLEDELDRDGKRRWFCRGQRNVKWSMEPKIFRELGTKPEDEYLSRLARARRAVRAMRESGIAADELQALAIAQHYSEQMDVRTWLLDVTTSPYVALFFASDGAEDDHIGIVDCIERMEWMLFSEGATEAVGAIRYVSPRGIPRIENQAGFFIEAPHPELYRQMSHRRFYFRQQKGVVFEDASAEPRISRDRIYPPVDPVLANLPKVSEAVNSAPLAWEPPLQSLAHPDETVFFRLAMPWLDDISKVHEDTIRAVCRLHAAIARQDKGLPHYIGTLHHLRRVVEAVVDKRLSDVNDWFDLHYTSHIRSSDVANAFLECVVQACPQWEPVALELMKDLMRGE